MLLAFHLLIRKHAHVVAAGEVDVDLGNIVRGHDSRTTVIDSKNEPAQALVDCSAPQVHIYHTHIHTRARARTGVQTRTFAYAHHVLALQLSIP